MDAVKFDAADLMIILAKIAAGGTVSWIVAGILSLIGLFLIWKFKKFKNESAASETEREKVIDQADNISENQKIEESLKAGEDEIEKIKKSL